MEKAEQQNQRLWLWWLGFIAVVAFLVLVFLQIDSLRKRAEVIQPGLYAVTEVIDGDTITVNMNGSTETVRMIGLDTPETHRPETPVQCYGEAASEYSKKLINGSKVRLQADPLNTNRDRYNRLLRYVYLADGTLVERNLISEGYGFAYTQFPFQKTDEFKAYETAAKTANKGLWAVCEVLEQPNGIKQTAPAT